MPYMISKQDNKYKVYKQGADKKPEGDALGTHDTEADAKKQLAALYANSPEANKSSVLAKISAMIEKEGEDPEGVIKQIQKMIEDMAGNPDSDKGLNLSYAKSLHLSVIPELAAKFTARNEIKHYAFLWGNPDRVDIDTEFFTPSTEFWVEKKNDLKMPLTWDHAQDKKFNDLEPDPRVGATVECGDDEWGRWAISVLDTDQRYRKFIDQFIEEKRLGYSSDSAPQYIQREQQGKGVWLKRWPWFAGAMTAAPCEHRMKDFAPEFLKSLHLPDPEALEKQAWEWQKARMQLSRIKSYLPQEITK